MVVLAFGIVIEALASAAVFDDGQLDDDEVEDDVRESRARSARYALYRAYVKARWESPLGAGNRVRLPDCVVEAIRRHFPHPACCPETCDYLRGCEAQKHYTGYRTAAQSRMLRSMFRYVD